MNFNDKLIDDYGSQYATGYFKGTIFEFAIFEYTYYYQKNKNIFYWSYSDWLKNYGK